MQLLPKLFRKSKCAISQEEFDSWGEETRFTPDYLLLESHQWCIFFIADDMMQGRRAHNIMFTDQARYLGVAYTQDDFTMFKKNLGKATFPIVLEPHRLVHPISRAPAAPVRGELWAIRPPHIPELDKHRLNTVECTRRRVKIDIPYQVVTRHIEGDMLSEWLHYKDQRAWMYFGIDEYWAKCVYSDYRDSSFSPVELFHPKTKPETATEKFDKQEQAYLFVGQLEKQNLEPHVFWSNAIEQWVVRFLVNEPQEFRPYYYYTTIEDIK
jgi:hypothetical protein